MTTKGSCGKHLCPEALAKIENNLPLRVGDTAYGITWRGVRHTVLKGVVSEIYYPDENMTPCAVLRGITRGPIGVKVFRTRSEAEAALQKKE